MNGQNGVSVVKVAVEEHRQNIEDVITQSHLMVVMIARDQVMKKNLATLTFVVVSSTYYLSCLFPKVFI